MLTDESSTGVNVERVLPPAGETLSIACIGQEVSRELELGHDCRVYE